MILVVIRHHFLEQPGVEVAGGSLELLLFELQKLEVDIGQLECELLDLDRHVSDV